MADIGLMRHLSGAMPETKELCLSFLSLIPEINDDKEDKLILSLNGNESFRGRD